MTDQLERFFRIWSLLLPLGLLFVVISVIHFVFRFMHPVLFVLPNDPMAWLLLLTGVLLVLAVLSRGFKTRILWLVRQVLGWVQERRTRTKD